MQTFTWDDAVRSACTEIADLKGEVRGAEATGAYDLALERVAALSE